MHDLADIDAAEFPVSAARAHPISHEETARAFDEFSLPPPPGARQRLHVVVSRFIEEGIAYATGADTVRARVRKGALAFAGGADKGLDMLGAACVIDSVVARVLPPPDPASVASLTHHIAAVRDVAARVAAGVAPPSGRPINAPLYRLICSLRTVTEDAGAVVSVSGNDTLDGGGEASPFMRFTSEIMLVAVDRAGKVIAARPQMEHAADAAAYFEKCVALAMSSGATGARKLAELIRSAFQREEALAKEGKLL